MAKTNAAASADPVALQAEIDRLRAKLEKKTPLTLKVSSKGALSLYGLGRFPVTLYREQWERILDHSDAIRSFIEQNSPLLKLKE